MSNVVLYVVGDFSMDREQELAVRAKQILEDLTQRFDLTDILYEPRNVLRCTPRNIDKTRTQYDISLKQVLNSHYGKHLSPFPSIEKVIFNEPATIVYWADKTKTVVKCLPTDIYDKEKGLLACIAKKAHGNNGTYYENIKPWIPKPDETELHVGDVIYDNKAFPRPTGRTDIGDIISISGGLAWVAWRSCYAHCCYNEVHDLNDLRKIDHEDIY